MRIFTLSIAALNLIAAAVTGSPYHAVASAICGVTFAVVTIAHAVLSKREEV